MLKKGRGRLNNIDLMPREANHIVSWAAQELSAMDRSQVDIYQEFVERCQALMDESDGEIQFEIPKRGSFHSYSMRLAEATRRLSEATQMASQIAETFDEAASDDLTRTIAQLAKASAFDLLTGGKASSKDISNIASAIHRIEVAQGTSRKERRAAEEVVQDVIEEVGKKRGLSSDAINAFKAEFLGVRDE